MTTADRNRLVLAIMHELLSMAQAENFSVDDNIAHKIRAIATSSARGFRETVIIICIGRLLNPRYDPTTELYKCNPRAIYEGPIRSVLRTKGIPHGKSGILNVAKATEGLTRAWAAQRRGGAAAGYVVDLAEEIANSDNREDVKNIAAAMLVEMLTEAIRVAGYDVDLPQMEQIGPLTWALTEMVRLAPDSGNTAQRIVGLSLAAYHSSINSHVSIDGHEDQASTTNVTSKKPGDIIEATSDGAILGVFEITTKPFNLNRVEESIDAVVTFNLETGQTLSEVIVLCHPSDVPKEAELHMHTTSHLASLTHEGVRFEFLDLSEWLSVCISRLRLKGRQQLQKNFNDYVRDANTSERVKSTWRDMLQSQ